MQRKWRLAFSAVTGDEAKAGRARNIPGRPRLTVGFNIGYNPGFPLWLQDRNETSDLSGSGGGDR
ncbi:MAG: hypothetical protein ACWGNB_01565, partial [Thiogranum sp.]